VRKRWLRHGKAPLVVAALLSAPLFFCALMAVPLAIEKPVVVEWTRHGHLLAAYHQASSAMEARIWLLALADALLLVLAGVVATFFRRGVYISAVAAIVLALGTTHRLDHWTAHHTLRYPLGMDLIRETSTSNTLSKGQWEATARITSLSFAHWTIVLATAAIVISLVQEARGRRGAPAAAPGLPPESTPQPPGMAI
jgi:hypothetical protein